MADQVQTDLSQIKTDIAGLQKDLGTLKADIIKAIEQRLGQPQAASQQGQIGSAPK
jgi:hypothetical protein